MKTVGVLALQGAYEAHQKKIALLGYDCILIKTLAGLDKADAIILPGGESTTMTYLLQKHHLWETLMHKAQKVPTLATCAGVILLQKLGLLDVEITRNGYGRQLASGIYPLDVDLDGTQKKMNGFFIRAPIVDKVNDTSIEVLSHYQGKPVLLRKDNILAATFHPELSEDTLIHKAFMTM
ncbi:pyridoxal 5'-phosphate synthase glutaminase subunit PdxT [Facilibium subflavum]|uniref:pyridoxal 5'-phosphate synthase glutaminase subunit PdxT n=1 Tax=Facilibium subflavum TaxID=2219058 RepID=UPI000E645F74|nr:pyridoxal 5'-phosphate synthase glutaminase subunit PdxT [Facilibium subflavum]